MSVKYQVITQYYDEEKSGKIQQFVRKLPFCARWRLWSSSYQANQADWQKSTVKNCLLSISCILLAIQRGNLSENYHLCPLVSRQSYGAYGPQAIKLIKQIVQELGLHYLHRLLSQARLWTFVWTRPHQVLAKF